MSDAKRRFTKAERFGVWVAHDRTCFWCSEPIAFAHCSVDHVVPESLENEPAKLSALCELYALGDGFDVNSFENWVPAHLTCNSVKGARLEPHPSPAMIEALRRVRARAALARRRAQRITDDVAAGEQLARILTAVDGGAPMPPELQRLLDSLVSATADAAFDTHYPGWARIDFADQEGLEAALSGDSMGPRHVQACPEIGEVDDIVRRLRDRGAVAVIGESGSGKSMAAWHAAYRLHKDGWAVYFLANSLAAVGRLPTASPRALLVVDDVQAMASAVFPAALSGRQRAILAISTTDIPGFRNIVRIVAERSVATIAAAFRSREAELLPILSKLYRHVGERSGDTPVSSLIDEALRASQLPWQFMFNLGRGERHLLENLESLRHLPRLETLLFAIAVYQRVSQDRPCPNSWLQMVASREGPLTRDDVAADLNTLASHVKLVRTARGTSLPHAQIARRIVELGVASTNEDAHHRRTLVQKALIDSQFQLKGVQWLLNSLPRRGDIGLLPRELAKEVLDRCFALRSQPGAGNVVDTLVSSFDALPLLVSRKDSFVDWIATCPANNYVELALALNAIINNDKDLAHTLIDSVDPATIANKVNDTTGQHAGDIGYLLGRLAFGSADWRHRVSEKLRLKTLRELCERCTVDELGGVAELVEHLHWFDAPLALELTAALVPVMITSMKENARRTVMDTRALLWWVLRFGPRELLRLPPREERHTAILHSVFMRTGADNLVTSYERARRRDWEGLDTVTGFLREAAPDVASAVARKIDIAPMLSLFRTMTREGPYEFEHVLKALALDDEFEPAKTVANLVCDASSHLGCLASILAPSIALDAVRNGKSVGLDLSTFLPDWGISTAVLAQISELDPAAGQALLRSVTKQLAQSLAAGGHLDGEHCAEFIRVARIVDREALISAMRTIDLDRARAEWSRLATGSEGHRAALNALLALAEEAGGEISTLAVEVKSLLL